MSTIGVIIAYTLIITDMKYTEAIKQFNEVLMNSILVERSAEHYGVTKDKVVQALQCRIYTKSSNNEVKKVWLDYVDTCTNFHFNHSLNFNK